MKRNSKKFIAILLALVMVLAQIPVMSSAAEDGDPVILHQPTYGQPYFEVTGSPTGYQWYYDTEEQVKYTAVGEVTGDQQVLVSATHGAWDAENGVYKSESWEEGAHCLTLKFDNLEQGDMILIPNFMGEVVDVFNTLGKYYQQDNQTVIHIENFELETAIVLSIEPTAENALGEFSVAPVILRFQEKTIAMEGQNKSTFELSEPEYLHVYCVATYQDGKTLKSDLMDIGYYCYSEPTWKNPTALFTWEEYITGYQWHRYEEKVHTWKHSPYEDNFNRGLRYDTGFHFDSELQQYVTENSENTTFSPNAEIYLQKGDIITFTMSEGYDGTASFRDEAKGEEYFPLTLEDGKYTYTVSDDTLLEFIFTDDVQFAFTITIKGFVSAYFPIEGETDKTLKNFELGEYLCKAFYKVGEDENWHDITIRFRLDILENPTAENPTVTVNLPEKAKFQWYQPTLQDFSGNLVDMSTGAEGLDAARVWEGFFSAEAGAWVADGNRINVGIAGMEGTTISITVPEGFDGYVGECYSDVPFEQNNGVFSYTFEHDYSDGSCYDLLITSENMENYSVTIKVEGQVYISKPIEGQNTATLTASKPGRYYCEITGTDGSAQKSETIEYYYEVTQQPTEEKPEVSVNFGDQVKGYQWYSIVKEQFAGYLTKEQAEDVMDFTAEIQADGTWKSVQDEPYNHVISIVTGEATIKMDIPEGATVVGYYNQLEDGTYTAKMPHGLLLTIYAEEAFTIKPYVTINTREDVAVEGQTSAVFSGEKTGTYYCEIEYKDGEKIISSSISYEPAIEKEPTESDPTVKVTNKDLVKSYQWYKYNRSRKSEALKPEHVIQSYNFYKNNKWQSISGGEGVHGVVFVLYGAPGDKLTLELPEGTDFTVDAEGGIYNDGVVTVEESYLRIIVTADKSFEMTAMWDHVDFAFNPIAGQTSETLTPSEPSYYYCVVTYQDGTKLQTHQLNLMQDIKNQPTNDAPVVEMLWPDYVEKYQWFKVDYPVKNVTNVSQATDTAIPGHGINATYSDGVWYSTVEEIDFDLLSFEVKEGDVIRVTTVGDTEISAVYYVHADYHWGDKMEHVGNGVYEHTVVEDMPVRINVVYSRTATATDGIKVEVVTMNVGEAVQGQTGAVFTGSAGHYLCVITDKDGVEYTTDIVTVSDYYLTKLPAEDDFTVKVNDPEQVESYQWYILEDVVATRPAVPSDPSDDEVEAFYSEDVIFHNNKWYATSGNVDYFGFEVSKGDVIIITPDSNFTGSVNFRDRASFAQIEEKDGSYIISITDDIEFLALYIENQESFTFTAAVKGTKTVAKKVEGAVSASFDAKDSGEYFCVVTMKDGTKLTSTSVKYEKPAEPPVSNDPVPPTGESMMAMAVGTVAILAMAAVLALGWDTKRKF